MFVWWGSVQDHDAGGRERAAQFPTENGRVPWVRRTTGCRFTGRQPRTSTGGMLFLQSAPRHSYHSGEFSHACWLVVVITFGFCSNSFVDFRTVSLEEGEHLANCVIESWADGVMKKLWYWMQRLSGCEWNELREYTLRIQTLSFPVQMPKLSHAAACGVQRCIKYWGLKYEYKYK